MLTKGLAQAEDVVTPIIAGIAVMVVALVAGDAGRGILAPAGGLFVGPLSRTAKPPA